MPIAPAETSLLIHDQVYVGPGQYFVITDIGNGRYQWYAFLARPADSEASEEKPDGSSPYLQNLFEGWSPEIHDILQATQARTAHAYQP